MAPWRLGLCLALLCGCGDHSSADGDGGPRPDGGGGKVDCGYDSHCGQVCSTDDNCGDYLYCGLDMFCRADCKVSPDTCGDGLQCIHGRCQVPCPDISVSVAVLTPHVVVLVDQSGSMSSDYGGGLTRYEALHAALTDATSGVITALQHQVYFGASLYTSHGGSAGGTCPILQEQGCALDNAGAIDTLLGDFGPDGDTPTGESLTVAADALVASATDVDVKTPLVIVLATDGEPDTCAVPNPQTGQPESIAAAQHAWDENVRVYILGVGSDVGAAHLQDMANAGAGLPVGGSENAPYYVATDPAAMTAAFHTIIYGVRSCTFTLNAEVNPDDADTGVVVLDGTTLTYQGADGWQLDDATTLELLGSACTTFLDDPTATLTATFPCGTVVQ